MSVKPTQASAIVVKSGESIPSPATTQTAQSIEALTSKQVQKLASDHLSQPQTEATTPTELKPQQIEKQFQIQQMLEDTSRSTFDKIKSLVPIPPAITPLLDLLLAKKTTGDIKVGVADDSLSLTADIKMPGAGIDGTVGISLPLTAQEAQDSLTEINPVVLDHIAKVLNPKLPAEVKIQEILKLLSTLPSQNIGFKWLRGSAIIHITLPNNAVLVINLLNTNPEKVPDIFKALLQPILKEAYAGIETLLRQDMFLKFDGATSRFEIEFPQRLALKINQLENVTDSDTLSGLIKLIGNNSMIYLPQKIGGFVNFKNPGIQFDPKTKFIIKNAPLVPDITINSVSFDPIKKKLVLSLKTSGAFPQALLKRFGIVDLSNLEIDLNESPEKKEPTDKKPTVFNFEFVPCNKPGSKQVVAQPAPVVEKPKTSVFESLKKIIKLPEPFSFLIGNLLSNQTELDVRVGIDDNVNLSSEVKIPSLGVFGRAHISIPNTLRSADQFPVKLPREIDEALTKFIADGIDPKSSEEVMLANSLVDLALTLPNQDISIDWRGDMATVITTLPGGITLKLELDIKSRDETHDTLRTELLAVLDAVDAASAYKPHQVPSQLIQIINTVGKHDFRSAQLLEVIHKETDLTKLRAELVKVLDRDILRTKLAEILGSNFEHLAPILTQTFSFKWTAEKKEFQIKFLEQQELSIKSLKLKKGNIFQNILRKIVGWLTQNRKITLPREVIGNVDFEKATITFRKGTRFTARGRFGLSKNVSIRSISFAENGEIDLGLQLFKGTRHKLIDPTTSSVDTAIMAINPVRSRARAQVEEL